MEKWSHLVPSRTQKLSTSSASIAFVNQARRQVIAKDIERYLFLFFFYLYNNKNIKRLA